LWSHTHFWAAKNVVAPSYGPVFSVYHTLFQGVMPTWVQHLRRRWLQCKPNLVTFRTGDQKDS